MQRRKPIIVGIAGGSGSGKSWLAEHVELALAPRAVHLRLDDFYLDLAHLPAREREAMNFDDPSAIDWEAVRGCVEAFERGVAAEIPAYDFATHTRRPGGRRLEPREILVFDGLWLLRPEWLRAKLDLRIYVECPRQERLRRRLIRDVHERGRSRASVLRQFEEQVQPWHQRCVAPQRQWASHCVRSPISGESCAALMREIEAAAVPPGRGGTNPLPS